LATTEGDRRRPLILVADDEPAILGLLSAALAPHGLDVLTVDDGLAAVEAFGRHAGEVDLVLLDVQMPGLDGPTALAALRGPCPTVRCWFMTGYAEHAPEALRQLGAERVVPKPFALRELVADLRAALGLAPPSPP
jgi:CheY-like chemotaxis protein